MSAALDPAAIDGLALEVRPGETILAGARRLGIEVPTLCHVPGLPPEGGCRLCLVEVEDGQRASLVAACHAPLLAGSRVRTHTEELHELRRGILELLQGEHPASREAHESPFGVLLAQHGLASPDRTLRSRAHAAVDERHTYLRFDAALCVMCRRCVQVCERIQGAAVYGLVGRGAEGRLAIGPEDDWRTSACTSCGACVDVCPSAAILDRDRLDGPAAERTTTSTCGYCGVGCQVEIETAGERVLSMRGRAEALVNRGHLCAKGRYAHGWQSSPERLTQPLVRDGKGFRAISWDAALDLAAERLEAIRVRHGGEALGVLTSSRSTNEATYLLQRLFRARLGSNNVDCCARVCHSSTALALSLSTGTGAASACYEDLERARCIVVAGANPTEAHPVVGARIEQAARGGIPLVVIDPRRISLVDHAVEHLALVPGTNVALFGALAKVMLEEDLVDRAYLAERCEGLAELEHFVAALDLEAAARECRLEPERIRAVARLLGKGPVLFVHGLGLSELVQGVDSVLMLVNLGMLTGSIGREGAGMLPLRGQNNVQGAADMGAMPDRFTGYQLLTDAAARERALELWGAAPPLERGLTIPQMLDAAVRGELRGLWIQGEDIVQSDPCETHVLAALGSLDFLVVQEMFLTQTARLAHLVLPAAGFLEQEGTFTNGERRIQRVRAAVSPPGEARPDWQAAVELGRRMGMGWSYTSPEEVMDEVARLAPALFGGVSYVRLEDDGLQWPCPDPSHPGTARVHQAGFLRGKGLLSTLSYEASPEHGVEGYPYLLVTGRVLHQYNVGSMTRRTPQEQLTGSDELEIAPADARREGLEDGRLVELESRWGSTRVRLRVSARVSPGELFLSFHFPVTRANRVVGPYNDPRSNCPQYKATAVRLSAG